MITLFLKKNLIYGFSTCHSACHSICQSSRSLVYVRLCWMKSSVCVNDCETKTFRRNKWGSVKFYFYTLLMSTEETLLNLDFDKPNSTSAPSIPDDGVVSLSSSSEEICLVPEVGFEGNVDSPGVNRESQPLLGGRGDFEVSFNHFPGTKHYDALTHVICLINHLRQHHGSIDVLLRPILNHLSFPNTC